MAHRNLAFGRKFTLCLTLQIADPGIDVDRLRYLASLIRHTTIVANYTLAGIGNVYAAEMLFLRGIEPWRPVGSIEDLPALVDLGHRLLDANKARPGHVTTGDTRRGKQNWVYGRAGEACRRCGARIKKGEQGPAGEERMRFWCSNCQL